MAIDPYLIPGTKTLQNKLGITDPAKLESFERKFTSARNAAALIAPVPGNLDFQHLKDIHANLFSDVYEWAGQTRTVNIAKDTSFAPLQNVDSFAKSTFNALKKDNYLQGLHREKFVDLAAHHLGEINAIHSFNTDSSKMKALLDKALIEPLKKKDRTDRLDELAANDPQAHTTIVDVREQLLGLSEKNIADRTSRENLANAVTDRLLNHHEQGRSVEKLVAPPQPKIDKGKGPLGR